jgi:hypothetical protein
MAVLVAAALLLGVTAEAASAPGARAQGPPDRRVATIIPPGEAVRRIERYRRDTWHRQRVMGRRPSPTTFSYRRTSNPDYRLFVLDVWRDRAATTWKRFRRPPNYSDWLCIHRYEGGWRDPGPPYYGGLQMDLEFQRTYGGYLLRKKGTADNWTPVEQMWVAERARRSGRGFYPWPNTARYCGLI